MLAHSHHFGYNRFASPGNSKDLSKLLQVLGSCFSDREDCVTQPAHAKRAKLFVEEFDAKLACKERNVLDYC